MLEDLGDDLFARLIEAGADETPLYDAAIDALVALHAERAAGACWTATARAGRC